MSNLSKETKQAISLNYSLEKNKELKYEVVNKLKNLIEILKNSVLKTAGISKEDLRILINKVNEIKNPTMTRSFITSSFNIDNLGSFPVIVEDMNISINGQNLIYYYYTNNQKSDYNNEQKTIDFNNFNYTGFGIALESLLKEDNIKEYFKDFKESEKSLLENLQTAYNNCYELIRNIRTLDRIEKKFPEVSKYLPENIILNESKESIQERFEKL